MRPNRLLSVVASAAFTLSLGPATALAHPGGGTKGAQAAKAAKPSDAEIAAIVVTANQVDVDAGKLAASRSSNPQVKALAERMVTDHTAVNQQAGALAQKLNLTPKESDASRGLKDGGDKNLANLRTLEGAAFDKAYVDNEVAYHQAVIQVLDAQLIPGAKNAELKGLLVKSRPAFEAHLQHAKQVQAALGGKAVGGAGAEHGSQH